MAIHRSELGLGRIVWVRIEDHHGFMKRRPAIILSPTIDIAPNEPVAVMAISTSFTDPPPPDHLLLPWNADKRRVATRLPKRSAAVLTWIRMINLDEIEELAGWVPSQIMREIIMRMPPLAD
jgi:hypothetical protein